MQHMTFDGFHRIWKIGVKKKTITTVNLPVKWEKTIFFLRVETTICKKRNLVLVIFHRISIRVVIDLFQFGLSVRIIRG